MELIDGRPRGMRTLWHTALSLPADRLGPAALALFDLFLANRQEDEDYARCFARLGAPGYAAMLRHAFEQAGALAPPGVAAGDQVGAAAAAA